MERLTIRNESRYGMIDNMEQMMVLNKWEYGMNNGMEWLTVWHKSSYRTNDATDGNMDRLLVLTPSLRWQSVEDRVIGPRAKPKVKKEIKTKEFTHQFCATSECYLLLLKTILFKHSQDKYKVTAQKHDGIKVLTLFQETADEVMICWEQSASLSLA